MFGKTICMAMFAFALSLGIGEAQGGTDDWRADSRRPAGDLGTADSSVEWWRMDTRRPARWPRRGGDGSVDRDGDGVPNSRDECPDTPRGDKVDDKGCSLSEKEVELLDTGTLRLQDIHFELNEATLLPDSYAVLDEVGEILAKWSELQIEIGGHTDSWGEDDYNRQLSERRAQSVLDYLSSRFAIQADQYSVKGYGESEPLGDNASPHGRAENRRVEFKVLNPEVLRRQESP